MPVSETKEDIRKKILLAALILAAATIPMSNRLNSISLIILVGACLVQQPLSESLRRLKRLSLWIFPVLFFIWFACTYFWDVTGGFGIRDIERYATLFFIPPALAMLPPLPPRYIKMTSMCFIAVTCVICIACLIMSYNEYQVTGDYRVFYYHYLANQLKLNAIFLSNYCLASIIWLLYFAFAVKKRMPVWKYFLICITVSFLFTMILMLSSKLIIFLMLLMLIAFVCYLGYTHGYLMRSLLITALIITTGLFAVNNLSFVKWRLDVTSLKKYSGKEDNDNGLSIRLLMWRNAWDLISKRPFIGYGIRGAREKIVETYRNENFQLGYEEGYHSHSEYLESALMGGIPAFIIFISMLIQAWWRAVRTRNMLLILMLFHFVCQSFIESTFEVQQELVFYILFLFLFYYHSPSLWKNNQFIRNGNNPVF